MSGLKLSYLVLGLIRNLYFFFFFVFRSDYNYSKIIVEQLVQYIRCNGIGYKKKNVKSRLLYNLGSWKVQSTLI